MPASAADIPKPHESGLPAGPKNHQKLCEKGRVKVETQSQEMSGLNLNPLAPAQSKRSFPLSGKTQNSIENASIPAPFFCPFLYLFSSLFPKSRTRGPGSRPRVLKRHQNGSQGCPNGAQGSQNGAPRFPQVAKKRQMYAKGVKMEPQVLQWGPKVPQSANKHTKRFP